MTNLLERRVPPFHRALRVLERRSDAAGAVEHLPRALAAWENADAEYEPAREARERLAALDG
ncbi:MAG: hypothetical protein F4X11_19300 [Acidobacteria bacterium]|nr:hypothetical protein [Acidobacteriota bacterium]